MDMKEVTKAVDGVMTSFEEFKKVNNERLKEIEEKGSCDPLLDEKLAKIEKTLGSFEDVSAKLTAAENEIKAAKDAAEIAKRETVELNDRTDELEMRLNRMPKGGVKDDPEELSKKRNLWANGVVNAFAKGMANLPTEQREAIEAVRAEYKVLNIGDDTTGGYLAPIEYVREIIKAVTEVSPARQIVRMRQTANRAVQVPKRTGQFAAVRTVEQGTRSETTGMTWGTVEINAPEMYALIDVNQQNLEDSAFNLEAEIREEAVLQFSKLEGAEFVTGTGIGTLEGITSSAANVASTNSGAATVITADGMINLKHALKSDYARNSTWIMNRTTLGSIRKLKDGSGAYLWMPGIAQSAPNTIDGDPYVEFPDMPNEGAGLKPVAYGDFRRAYTMLDRISMSMLRDPYTQATSGNIRFLFRRRVGGLVVLSEAIRLLNCAV